MSRDRVSLQCRVTEHAIGIKIDYGGYDDGPGSYA